jgi:hypothetical protein
MSNTSPQSLFPKRRGRSVGVRAARLFIRRQVLSFDQNLASLIEFAISQEATEKARGEAAHRHRAQRAH